VRWSRCSAMWTHASKPCDQLPLGLLAISLAMACGSESTVAPPPSFESSSGRQPGGILLEPEPAQPSPATHSEARGVVSLREPVAASAVARFVEAFLDAWRRESLDELTSMLSKAADVGPIEARGRGREAVVESWRQRLKAHPHEYTRLEGDLVATDRIESWGLDAESSLRDNLGDVCVSAPMEVTRTGSDRLFGNFLVMVLRKEQGGLRMVAYGETDQRPTH
jgi:hypothetical protein